MVGRAKTCARWGVVVDLEVHPEWGIPVVLNVLAQCLALGTHDAAAPSATLGIISAKTPAARQLQVGSSSCFRQLRAQGYGHVTTSWLVELRCRSRSHVPAPAVLHPCDAPCYSRRLVTPAAWSGGRKPAHGRRSCRSRDHADPGTAPGRLGSLTPGRRKRRHMARRHIMPYQDAGQQSHQLATWAHSITQGRSPPVKGAALTQFKLVPKSR